MNHVHVGSNMPGYMPHSDPSCFDSTDDAVESLKHELRDQQDYYLDRCSGHCDQCAEFMGCGDCAWCSVAADVEAALSAIADGDARAWFERDGDVSWLFSPPEGPDIAHWITVVAGSPDGCDLEV